MIVEIFTIGSELCYGRIRDTNSFWMADQLTRIGALVSRITCIRDGLNEICSTLREAIERKPHIIFTTGGLGPTSDDLTIEALAKLIHRDIILDKSTLGEYAIRRNMRVNALPKNIVSMARTLKGAKCIPNPVGGAPATVIEANDIMFITLPGPPREVRAIFSKRLKPVLKAKTGRVSVNARIVASMRESEVSPLLDQVMREIPSIYLKPLVKSYRPDIGLPIEILTFGENRSMCIKRLREVVERIRTLVEAKERKITLIKNII